MKLTDLLIDGLAAHRLARLVVDEDSPASMWIRDQAEQRLPAAWAPAVECRHCTGLWAALALGGLRAVGLGALAWPLAAAGLSSLVLEALHPEGDHAEPQGPVLGQHVEGDPRTEADDHPFGWASGERQGVTTAPGQVLVGRALSGQEAATGRTKLDYEGNPLPTGDRPLSEAEQRYGRLVR